MQSLLRSCWINIRHNSGDSVSRIVYATCMLEQDIGVWSNVHTVDFVVRNVACDPLYPWTSSCMTILDSFAVSFN